MHKGWATGVFAALAMLLATGPVVAGTQAEAAPSAQERAQRTRAQPVTAQGQPVRGADGARIVYSASQQALARGAGAPRRVGAAGSASAAATPAATAVTPSTWQFAAFGAGIGASGLVHATVRGRAEVYAAGSATIFGANNYWYALRYARSGAARQVFVSDPMPAEIVRIALARTRPELVSRIVVALADGTVLQYGQRSKRLLSTQAGDCAGLGGLSAFTTADMNGDGIDEFLSICQDRTLVVSGRRYGTWSVPDIGGTELVAANLDDDPAVEIATSTGMVVDGASHAVQWTWPSGFGPHLLAADLKKGKTYRGLIAASAWNVVTAFDIGA